jgi:hypothetical protein
MSVKVDIQNGFIDHVGGREAQGVLERTDGSYNLTPGFAQYSRDLKRDEEVVLYDKNAFIIHEQGPTSVRRHLLAQAAWYAHLADHSRRRDVMRASPPSECLRPRSMRRVPKPWPGRHQTRGIVA